MQYSKFILCIVSMFASCAIASPFDTSGETFQADLYPSQRTAIIRLTQQLAEQIKQTIPGFEAINASEDAALRDALHHEFPQADLVNENGAITFSVTSESVIDPVETKQAKSKHGRVTVHAK